MITLIIILPLVGSFLFLNINEETNTIEPNYVNLKYKNINNSIIKQIGLSTSLVVLALTICILSNSSFLLPDISSSIGNTISLGGEIENFKNLENIYSNSISDNPFGGLNSSSLSQLESVDSISLYYILLTAFITPICLLSN